MGSYVEHAFVLMVYAGEGGYGVSCSEYSDSAARLFGLRVIYDLAEEGGLYRDLPRGEYVFDRCGDGYVFVSAPSAFVRTPPKVREFFRKRFGDDFLKGLFSCGVEALPLPLESHLSV